MSLNHEHVHRILPLIYRGQNLIFDLSRTKTCPRFIEDGNLPSIYRRQVSVLRTRFPPKEIEGKFLSSINRAQEEQEQKNKTPSSINRAQDSE